jgi:hypothetical protein
MLGAGLAWFAFAVLADLAALVASSRVVDLDGRVGRLIPAVTAGFALQTLTGASPTCCRSSSAAGPTVTASSPESSSWPGRYG